MARGLHMCSNALPVFPSHIFLHWLFTLMEAAMGQSRHSCSKKHIYQKSSGKWNFDWCHYLASTFVHCGKLQCFLRKIHFSFTMLKLINFLLLNMTGGAQICLLIIEIKLKPFIKLLFVCLLLLIYFSSSNRQIRICDNFLE